MTNGTTTTDPELISEIAIYNDSCLFSSIEITPKVVIETGTILVNASGTWKHTVTKRDKRLQYCNGATGSKTLIDVVPKPERPPVPPMQTTELPGGGSITTGSIRNLEIQELTVTIPDDCTCQPVPFFGYTQAWMTLCSKNAGLLKIFDLLKSLKICLKDRKY